MIYSIPLDEIENKMILGEGQTRPDLQTSLFSVQLELISIDPVKRHQEARVWMFNDQHDITEV